MSGIRGGIGSSGSAPKQPKKKKKKKERERKKETEVSGCFEDRKGGRRGRNCTMRRSRKVARCEAEEGDTAGLPAVCCICCICCCICCCGCCCGCGDGAGEAWRW
jgi:hypothetical protein